MALSRATETLAFVDVAGDDDAHALSADLLEDAAPYHADDLVEHFADDAPPEERVQARTKDARGLIDTAPGRAWQRACQAMRLLGDPQLPNGVSDESVRIEARTTLLATAARLLVDGGPRRGPPSRGGQLADEAIVLLGASGPYAQALQALDAWTEAPQTAPLALLDATLALDSDGSWLGQALPPMAQRLRDAVEAFAGKRAEAAAYAGDVEGWLKLTGYAGDAAATARALRGQAVDTLTDGGETLAEVGPVSRTPILLARRRSPQCRSRDRRTRRHSDSRWSSWFDPGVHRESWLGSSSRRPRRYETGSRRLIATLASAPTVCAPKNMRRFVGCAGRTGGCAKNAKFWQKPRPGSRGRPDPGGLPVHEHEPGSFSRRHDGPRARCLHERVLRVASTSTLSSDAG